MDIAEKTANLDEVVKWIGDSSQKADPVSPNLSSRETFGRLGGSGKVLSRSQIELEVF
jgi:hypothetical protein